MSERPPPFPNVNDFNNLYWLYYGQNLNIGEMDNRYLRFPVSQGSETINGNFDVLGGITALDLIITNTITANSIIGPLDVTNGITVYSMSCHDITATGPITANSMTTGTLNYTTLNPPIPSSPIAGLGANYKMPFNVFSSTSATGSTGPVNVFQMVFSPGGWSAYDIIYLKVNMRHLTTFNSTTAPFSVIQTESGYYDGVWVINPRELSNPALAGTTPVFDGSPGGGTGNPISGGNGYGPDVYNTSETYGSFGELFYEQPGAIKSGNWGSGTNNGVVWRYLNINSLSATRNQSMSGTIEIFSAVNSGGGPGNVTLKAYNSQGGYTFNDSNSITTF